MPHSSKKLFLLPLVVCATISAQDFRFPNWVGGDGDWMDPGNWSSGSVPVNNASYQDYPAIGNGGTANLNAFAPDTYTVSVNDGTFNVGADGSIYFAFSIAVDDTMNITDGGVVDADGGVEIDGGVLTVDGAGGYSNLIISGAGTAIGQNGTLSVTNGGYAMSNDILVGDSNGPGNLNVAGANSQMILNTSTLTLGQTGQTGNTMNVTGGAVVQAQNYRSTQGESLITVSGDDGSGTASTLIFGVNPSSAVGSLWVSSGGIAIGDGGIVYDASETGAELGIGGTGNLYIGSDASVTENQAMPGFIKAGGVSGSQTIVHGGSLYFNHSSTGYYFTDDGTSTGNLLTITGELGLFHNAGVTILTNDYDYTGGTTVNGGTMRLESASIGNATTPTGAININGDPSANPNPLERPDYLLSLTDGSSIDATGSDLFITNYGELRIEGGSTVTLGSSEAPLFSYVGATGQGQITIQGAGSSLSSGGNFQFGGGTGNDGFLELSEQGSMTAGSVEFLSGSGSVNDATMNLYQLEVSGDATFLNDNGGSINLNTLSMYDSGNLEIMGGSQITAETVLLNGADALLTVSGADGGTASTLHFETGTATIYAGTLLVEQGGAALGAAMHSAGEINVQDSGSVLDLGTYDLTLNGGMSVTNGGLANAGSIMIAQVGNNAVTMNVDNAEITSSGLIVGGLGAGTLNVTNGAVVKVGGGTGTAVLAAQVDFPASLSSTGNLNIGGDPAGAPSAPGFIQASAVTTGDGTGTINFNHTSSGYYFTSNGESDGAGVSITAYTAVAQHAGTTILTEANTYSEGTTLYGGILALANTLGSATGTGDVTVQSGATLAGNGIASGGVVLQSGAFLAPGMPMATGGDAALSVGALTWDGGATVQIELGESGASDSLIIAGAFAQGEAGAYLFDFQNTGEAGQTYTIVTAGSTTFSADDFSYANLADGLTGTFAFDGNDLTFSTVPEPTTFALLTAALALGWAALRRRR